MLTFFPQFSRCLRADEVEWQCKVKTELLKYSNFGHTTANISTNFHDNNENQNFEKIINNEVLKILSKTSVVPIMSDQQWGSANKMDEENEGKYKEEAKVEEGKGTKEKDHQGRLRVVSDVDTGDMYCFSDCDVAPRHEVSPNRSGYNTPTGTYGSVVSVCTVVCVPTVVYVLYCTNGSIVYVLWCVLYVP